MKKRSIKSKAEVMQSMSRFLPDHFVEYVTDIFLASDVRMSIVRSRATKLGDFRAGFNGEKHRITVNGDLNPYSFLVTTLHEFAHLNTFNRYGTKVLPHGEEWKLEFRKLLLPVIDSKELPAELEKALVNSLVNMKASSCTDHNLSRALLSHDTLNPDKIILEELPTNSSFLLNGREFIKGPLRRKRYVCREVSSNRSYLVSSLAQVHKNDNERNEE
jgi:SprT protein